MSHFQLEPSESQSGSFSRTLLLALLILAAFLAFVGTLVALNNSGLAFGPTPTPTATARLATTATPDFRATRYLADQLTAEAYRVAQSAATALNESSPTIPPDDQETSQPTDELNATDVPGTGTAISEPVIGEDTSPLPDAGSGETTVNLPVIISGSQEGAEDNNESQQPSPLATPTDTPEPLPTATEPLPTPTFDLPTPTPALPTPTPTSTLQAVPTTYIVDSLIAVVDESGADVRKGPGTNYEVKGTFDANIEVKLLGRTRGGEWVYACCVNNEPGWIRQVEAPPRNNEFEDDENEVEDDPPENADPNDVRWLQVQSIDSSLTVPPSPTAIPADDFPLYRYDRSNQARLSGFPTVPIQNGWPTTPYEAGSQFTTGVTIFGQSVIAANADNHIYSIHRTGGNQRWRAKVDATVRFAPAIQDSTIYVVDDAGTVYAFVDNGNVADERWRHDLAMVPTAGINIAGDKLFIPGSTPDAYRLYALNRNNGDLIHQFSPVTNTPLGYPAIGDQLVYIAGEKLWALDYNDINRVIWEYSEFIDYTVPPVYTDQGVLALAEIIVATRDGNLHIIDANTKRRKLSHNLEQVTTGLAVDDLRIYAAGSNRVSALDRRTLEVAWTSGLDSPAVGGPIVGPGQIITFQESGAIIFFDATQGSQISGVFIPPTISGTGAVSGQWLFTANTQGGIYGYSAAP